MLLITNKYKYFNLTIYIIELYIIINKYQKYK